MFGWSVKKLILFFGIYIFLNIVSNVMKSNGVNTRFLLVISFLILLGCIAVEIMLRGYPHIAKKILYAIPMFYFFLVGLFCNYTPTRIADFIIVSHQGRDFTAVFVGANIFLICLLIVVFFTTSFARNPTFLLIPLLIMLEIAYLGAVKFLFAPEIVINLKVFIPAM